MKIGKYLVLGFCSLILFAGCGSSAEEKPAAASSTRTSGETATAEKGASTSTTATLVSSTSSSSTFSPSSESVEESPNSMETVASHGAQLNDLAKNRINLAFLNWASQRAVMGNMAVSDWFFDHGAAGHGDWYANTPDGQVQVQNNDMPGKRAFPIHAIGGCIFYTAKDGGVGKQELFADSFAANYSVKLDHTKPVSKYLLGDNGVVYELKTGNGMPVSTNTGFGEYEDDGSQGVYRPDLAFQRSEDQAAQEKLQELILSY
ncbi:hypothetical protein P7H00_00855 [Enterococcus pseudoavium]|uniref:Lipoprotein n=1 Tax=Enterococcus pseudoavium TaxID=44007 RepID=A0AAE4KVL2_9ENTE|nr:hypothetical protein [Enterococcus pseudoavium]MDT2735680.1 hypothetical protein [Enterococcus pseudoavium]